MAYNLTQSMRLTKASSQYAGAADSASLDVTGNITIEGWIMMKETLGSGSYRALVIKSTLGASDRGYEFLYGNVGGTPRLLFYFFDAGTPTNYFEGYLNFTLTADVWYHVAMTCTVANSAATKMKWYINGSYVGAGTGTNTGTGATTIFNSTKPCRIGQADPLATGYYPDAQFNLVRIWDTIRTDLQIRNNYRNVLGSTTNLKAEWTLDNTYADNSGNGNTLTGSGSPTFVSSVPSASTFKQATVNASDVPATQTDFPAYVDLSRIGITTLAQAQSVRVFNDTSQTTEWAREIVSATEMHVKVPSLTSTVSIYVDYDATRADYAATDTYGRNAVWSGYSFVYHMEDNANSSTGSNNGTATNVTYTTGNIGKSAVFASASSARIFTTTGLLTNVGTASVWFKSNTTTEGNIIYNCTKIGVSDYFRIAETAANKVYYVNKDDGASGSTNRGTSWNFAVNTWDTSTAWKGYLNGVLEVTGTGVKNPTNSYAIALGCLNDGNGVYTTLPYYYNGQIGEARLATTRLSENWITTEYNNQSDEAGFWGTWSTVGGSVNSSFLTLM